MRTRSLGSLQFAMLPEHPTTDPTVTLRSYTLNLQATNLVVKLHIEGSHESTVGSRQKEI